MPLTLTQFLLLVLTFSAVVAVAFFVVFLAQLKRTAKQGEEILIEIKELVKNLNETTKKVHSKIDDLGEILHATKKITSNLAEAIWYISTKMIKPSSHLWPFLLPVIKFSWRHLKKKKEDKNVK